MIGNVGGHLGKRLRVGKAAGAEASTRVEGTATLKRSSEVRQIRCRCQYDHKSPSRVIDEDRYRPKSTRFRFYDLPKRRYEDGSLRAALSRG